jgi:hypothetical protein
MELACHQGPYNANYLLPSYALTLSSAMAKQAFNINIDVSFRQH